MQAAAGVVQAYTLEHSMVCANVCMWHGVCICMHVAWCVQMYPCGMVRASSVHGREPTLLSRENSLLDRELAYKVGSPRVLCCEPLVLCAETHCALPACQLADATSFSSSRC